MLKEEVKPFIELAEDSVYTQAGYLTSVQVISQGYQNLPHNFSWENIPMLSVITGKNGTGKSNLLQGILFGFQENHHQIKLNFQENIENPEICSLQNTDRISSLRSNVEEDSKKNFNAKLNSVFEDLKQYAFFRQLGKPYEPKFKNKKIFYDSVIENAVDTIERTQSFSFPEYELALKKCFNKANEVHLAEYNSLENTAKRILETIFYKDNPYTKEEKKASLKKTLETINHHLQRKKFKYCFSEESFKWNINQGCFDGLALTLPENHKSFINHSIVLSNLSSGEKLELLILLWEYEKKGRKPAILIMDEPDAHLHPSLVKEIIEIIKIKAIKEWGVQVIMTTHNPTTVSLVPKDCLWVLQNHAPDYQPRIRQPASKKEAIQLLTSDFVSVNEPFKLVFVEAEADKRFYQVIREKLIVADIIRPNEQVLFMMHSKDRKNSSCDLVESIVENCVENPNDEDKNLREHIFGIVDGDNKKKHTSANILATRRYSIENYIYDPVHIFFCVKNKNSQLPSFLKLEEEIKNKLKTKGIKNELDSLEGVYNDKEKAFILQTLADSIMVSVMDFFQQKLDGHDNEFQAALKKFSGDRFKHLVKENSEGKKGLITDKEDISFTNGVQLSYPKFLLEMQGHCLEFIYSRFFSEGRPKEEKLINKDYILNTVCKNQMMIPQELAGLFITLQEPVKHLDQPKKQVLKNTEKNISQFEITLEKNKKDIAGKEEKIKGQKTKIDELEKKIAVQKTIFSNLNLFYNQAKRNEAAHEINIREEAIEDFKKNNPSCPIQ